MNKGCQEVKFPTVKCPHCGVPNLKDKDEKKCSNCGEELKK